MIISRLKNLFSFGSSDLKDILPFDFFDRSERMKQLHREGRYAGTSKISEWNKSEERKERMQNIRSRNAKDKTSKGYGSEYKMRVDNRNLILSQYRGTPGFFYFLDFPTLDSIKVGYSKNWEFRTKYQLVAKKTNTPEKVLMILSGKSEDLADLEYNTLLEFQDYTRLDSTGTRYTEFLDRHVKSDVYSYILDWIKNSPSLFNVELNNFS